MDLLTILHKYPKILIAIWGSLCLAIGYLFKRWRERKNNLKEALFILLEIWHRMVKITAMDLGKDFDAICSEISKRTQSRPISESEKDVVRKILSPYIYKLLQSSIQRDYQSFEGAYFEATKKVAQDAPLLAYQISSTRKTKSALEALDTYFDEVLRAIDESSSDKFIDDYKLRFKTYLFELSASDIEKDIKALGLRIGILTYWGVSRTIRNRKKRLQTIDKKELEDIVEKILLPT